MKKNKTAAGMFVIACFLIFIFLALGATVLKDKETYSFFENRSLARMPAIERESVLSGKWGSDVEKFLSDHAAGRTTLLKVNALIDMNLLQRVLVNDVVVTDDCLLPWNEYETVREDSINAQTARITQNLKSVNHLVESLGGKFYYVGVPCQYVFREDDYPEYLNDRQEYTDASSAAIAESLKNSGISYIDMGPIYEELGFADYLTSAVDNHFSIYGAYLAYLEIMNAINADTDLDVTTLRDGDFEFTELPNPYLGSRQRKLFNLWRNGETLSIVSPNVDVPFIRTDNGSESAPSVYDLPSNTWDTVPYSLYMGGDMPSTVIDTGREELPSILVYGDSFTNAVECILWYGFDKMYSLDMRYYTDSTLGEFISAHKPDIVVCIRDYEALISTDYNGCGIG